MTFPACLAGFAPVRLPARIKPIVGFVALLAAIGCAPTGPRPVAPVLIPVPVPPSPVAPLSDQARFAAFLSQARATAIGQGISAATFDSAVRALAPIPALAAMNANQPEFARPIWSYLDGALSPRRVADGRRMLTRYGDVLARIQAFTGVRPEILLAIWGLETDYGADLGDFNLFAALATLAYEGPRADYARPEFFAALQIYQQQHYPLSEMTASWAGAFGQTQFTPTTFLKYAVDGDGDGKIDLWRSAPDALASAAQLLSAQGWKKDQPWGYEVMIPEGFAYELADGQTQKSLEEWRALGIKTAAGAPLPVCDDHAAVYLPAGAEGPAFLIFSNFGAILKYNNAASYALAVALLADRIAGAEPVSHAWPRQEPALSRSQRFRFQSDLAKLGFDLGAPDGVLGRKTRAALRLYQKSKGRAADGFATMDWLAMLDADAAR